METIKRSIAKSASWRVLATVTTFAIVWIVTGELIIAAGVIGFEMVIKTLIYYTHERVWDRIKWGVQ